MSSIIKLKPTKPAFSPAQKTFQRLKKKIEALQAQQQQVEQTLEECLLFYLSQLKPLRQQLHATIKEFILIIYGHYKNRKKFKKSEREMLKEIVTNKIEHILSSSDLNEDDEQLCAIYKELEGVDFKKAISEQLDEMKEALEMVFQKEGLDLDLSELELNPEDDEQDILHKIFGAMREAALDHEEVNSSADKCKSKKQLKEEQKRQQQATLEQKSLSSIYKQLAKAFHPDLEPDPKMRAEKELLMKKLTCAYEEEDLHTLLSLEIEWMSRNNQERKQQSDEQIKLYNNMLKDQVAELQADIQMALINPKYLLIHSYVSKDLSKGITNLKKSYKEMLEERSMVQDLVTDLKSAERDQVLQGIFMSYYMGKLEGLI